MDEFGNIVYDTKIAISIPDNYVGLIFPRSSVSRYALALANGVGVIDSGYRGSILLKFKPTPYYDSRTENEAEQYKVGDRVGQLVILELPPVVFKEVEKLTDTTRGIGGFGSSNKKQVE